MELKYLFSPKKIGNVQIKNRIVRSATYEKRASKYGLVTDRLIELYTDLAQGGAGLIITGMIAVHPSGSGSPYAAYLYDDSFLSGQRKLVKAVHDRGSIIAAQIAHTGRQGTHPKYEPIAPSAIFYDITNRMPRELTPDEITEVITWFVDTGRRAYESGYDMVQLHAAHGYLLCNFISPRTNIRTDEYGGNTQKRTQIFVDIFNQLRDEVGKNFPIIIKLQTQDFIPGGLSLNEGKEVAKILVDTGYNAIEPSGGGEESQIGTNDTYPSKIIKSPEDENYFLPTIKELKPLMKDCPIILMGGIKNPLSAEKFLQEKIADFISMSRPLIREPDLPNRWKSGDISPARCISCNECFETMFNGEVYCVVRKRLENKKL